MTASAENFHSLEGLADRASKPWKRYPKYRASGVEWLGDVPAHWALARNHALFQERNERGRVDWELLAVTQRAGVIRQTDIEERKDTSSDDKSNYKVLRVNDLAYNKMRMWQGAIGVSSFDGIVSPAYVVLTLRDSENSPAYFYYQYKSPEFIVDAGRLSYGICDDMNSLRFADFKTIYSLLPPPSEQNAIAIFLDRETGRIDALIAKKERQIELLQEKRQALITHAVTKGLDPKAKMKDSGVEWLGQIPEGWIVCRLGRQIELQRGVDTTKETQNDGDIPVVSSGGISSYHDRAFASGPGVVVGRKGTAGSVHYIDSAFWPHDTTLWVKQFRGNHPKFVYYKLRSMNLGSFDTGSANPTLNRNLIHPVIVSWPLPIEQPVIAARLDCETTRIDAMAAKIDSSMTLLREYRTALISAAVTGKIDVRGCGEYPEAAATEMLLAAEALAEYGSPGGS